MIFFKHFRYLIYLSLFFNNFAIADQENLLQQGEMFFQQREFAEAILHWESALNHLDSEKPLYIKTLIQLSSAYNALNKYEIALDHLEQALDKSVENSIQTALIHSHFGDTLLALQKTVEAEEHLKMGIKIAELLDNPLILAHLYIMYKLSLKIMKKHWPFTQKQKNRQNAVVMSKCNFLHLSI